MGYHDYMMKGLKMELTKEQLEIAEAAIDGKNLLIDACIGSGKTTTLQVICNVVQGKRILYLTYNKLLKLEAKKKIYGQSRTINNYHGFAFYLLTKIGVRSGQSDLIRNFIKHKNDIQIPPYQLLLIDEYQDIDQEISEMLAIIKKANPNMQIIAVGDMAQKIYDMTTLDVKKFISKFLGNYEFMSLSTCFRLSAPYAARLGNIWQKTINGVNENMTVQTATLKQAIKIAQSTAPQDLLCLGARDRGMVKLLNELEETYPKIFNKKTVYASIRDSNSGSGVNAMDDVAIFTTFDSAKGLEKPVCLVFDFTEGYYKSRSDKNNVKYEILRNIFCVAASRAKGNLVYVLDSRDKMLSDKELSVPFQTKQKKELQLISEMFDFKYKESVDACFDLLECEELETKDNSEIEVTSADYNIDLMPCIGIFQEFSYFDNYDYDKALNQFKGIGKQGWAILDEIEKLPSPDTTIEKVLYLAACQTMHMRYAKQVAETFITNENTDRLHQRLAEVFSRDELVQIDCRIKLPGLKAKGLCDVLKEDTVYELKFVNDLTHEHFLQLATYMYALDKNYGVLWNTRNNQRYMVKIPDRKKFIKYVEATVNKQELPAE